MSTPLSKAAKHREANSQISSQPVVVHWFRRDLRLEDNTALSAALSSGFQVVPIFIFDPLILAKLPDHKDRRVHFIRDALATLQAELREKGGDLLVVHDEPEAAWRKILAQFKVEAVYVNRDYEPYALDRDRKIRKLFEEKGVRYEDFKDQVIFEKREVAKKDGDPYTVFTPYSKKWLAELSEKDLKAHDSSGEKKSAHLLKWKAPDVLSLKDIGFEPTSLVYAPPQLDSQIIKKYADQRDVPSLPGTTRLGIHLRFGTVSVREAVRVARKHSEIWLKELIWREFFMQILWNFPHAATGPFRKEYAAVKWRHDEAEFEKWKRGSTGYPIVDAGMRELNATGFMHNRVRMIAASFLVKHLLIDWQWGEKYFADKLDDFELASNNGNWQWVAGCGCDAAPYFRIFNPETQTKRFDGQGKYIKKWVPEVDTSKYPQPMIEHRFARYRTLTAYSKGLGRKAPEPLREDELD